MACGRKQFTEPWQVCREFSEAGQLHKPPHQIITARKDPAEDVLLAFERQGNGSTRSSLARRRAQNGMSRIIASWKVENDESGRVRATNAREVDLRSWRKSVAHVHVSRSFGWVKSLHSPKRHKA